MSEPQVAILHDRSEYSLLLAQHLSKGGVHLVFPFSEGSPELAQQVCDEVRQSLPGALVTAIYLDRSKPESIPRFVQEFASRFARLDLLYVDANVGHLEKDSGGTSVRFDASLFSLIRELWPLLGQAGPSRVVLQTWVSLVPLSASEPLGSEATDYARALEERGAMETSLAALLAAEGASRRISVHLWSLFGIRELDSYSWLYRLFRPWIEGRRGKVVLTYQEAADMLIYLATSPALEGAPAKHYVFGRRDGFLLAPYPKTDEIAQSLWNEAGRC